MVWVAHDAQLRRPVALKLLHEAVLQRPDRRAHFEREAWLLAQLRSPHIVQVYDSGIEAGQPFIVMELLEGESLEARLRRHPCLPLPIVAKLIHQIAEGLAATHHAGIVHCDLKPANVFLAREPGRELVKLLDFGVATVAAADRASTLEETIRCTIAGTLPYMSPEQFSGLGCRESADVWSLAVLAYQMLTGRWPFQGESFLSMVAQVCSGAFPPPSSLVRGLSPALDELFARAFAQDIAERPASAQELSAELRALVDNVHDSTLRILFIDDEPDMEFLLKQRFRRCLPEGSYELFFARSGEEGLNELRRRSDIDVVLTDINMPGMDGLTFLSHVPEVNPIVRVVVVSAYGDMTNIRTAMNRGAFDFLCKPIDFDDLQRTIRKCAESVALLRSALASAKENSVMRVLVGSGLGERLVQALRRGEGCPQETFPGCVAYVRIRDPFDANDSAEASFRRLNAHFDLIAPEIAARAGRVVRFLEDSFVVLFEGEESLPRAVEACFAIRERVRALPSDASLGRPAVAMALDSGMLASGGLGSLAMDHLEHVLLGGPVRRAARLQRSARWNEIIASAVLWPHLECDYVCEPIVLRDGEEDGLCSALRIMERTDVRRPSLQPPTVEMEPLAIGTAKR